MDPLVAFTLFIAAVMAFYLWICGTDPYQAQHHSKGVLMSQDYELLGQLSPAAERVAAQKIGWQGDQVDTLGQEITDQSDFSAWDRRANKQAMGSAGGNYVGNAAPDVMASHQEISMAGIQVSPPAPEEAHP
jgi:hypothetical protein